MKLRSLWYLILSIGLFTAPSALAQPKCVHPDPNNFLEQSRSAIGFTGTWFPAPSAIFLNFQLNGNYFQWMGASWWGPSDGALFVLNCEGDRLAALRFGQIEQLEMGPAVPGFGKTIEAIYLYGEGTGDQQLNVRLMAFSGRSIAVLWDHEASESVSEPNLASYTDKYTWRYSDSGTVIRVTGRRTVGELADTDHGWAPYTAHALPSETFCWNGDKVRYASCHGK